MSDIDQQKQLFHIWINTCEIHNSKHVHNNTHGWQSLAIQEDNQSWYESAQSLNFHLMEYEYYLDLELKLF